MPKTKIVWENTCMHLLEAKGGLMDRSSFCREPPKMILLIYFDTFLSSNGERSKIKAFLKVSLVSLTIRLCNVFKIFEKR